MFTLNYRHAVVTPRTQPGIFPLSHSLTLSVWMCACVCGCVWVTKLCHLVRCKLVFGLATAAVMLKHFKQLPNRGWKWKSEVKWREKREESRRQRESGAERESVSGVSCRNLVQFAKCAYVYYENTRQLKHTHSPTQCYTTHTLSYTPLHTHTHTLTPWCVPGLPRIQILCEKNL